METCGKVAAACILGVLGSLPQGAAVAAELIVLTNQGATPRRLSHTFPWLPPAVLLPGSRIEGVAA